jgi:hypothetical protein
VGEGCRPQSGLCSRPYEIAGTPRFAERHAPGDREIIGAPEERDVDPRAAYFSPCCRARAKRLRYPIFEAS